MNFSEALVDLKDGKRLARAGWNGKGMWIILFESPFADDGSDALGPLQPYLIIRSADGSLVPWTASQTDILAEDWVIVQ